MPVGGCCFSSDDVVIKSSTDSPLYRLVKLRNGLSALLVHDPEIYPDGPPELVKNFETSDDEEQKSDDDDGEEEQAGVEEGEGFEKDGEVEEEEESKADGCVRNIRTREAPLRLRRLVLPLCFSLTLVYR